MSYFSLDPAAGAGYHIGHFLSLWHNHRLARVEFYSFSYFLPSTTRF
jgi:hypothetical protein